jgi:hypothetical protein
VATKTTIAAVQSNANNFTAQQTFSSGAALADQQLRIRAAGDGNHYVQYNSTRDGPDLCGASGGRLGYGNASNFTERIRWNSAGVVVSGTLTVNNNVSANSQTVTPAQIGYLSGASSNLQTQLNGKPVSSGSYSGKNFCQTNNIFSVLQMDVNNGGSGQQFPSSSVSTLWNLTGGGAEADFVNCAPNSGYLGAGFQFYNVAADATLSGGSTPFAILRPGTSVLTGSLSVGNGISINNGGLIIIESTGNSGAETSGTITLKHDNNGGVSSIIFPSKNNNGSDYGYIRYRDDVGNTNNGEAARLEIGLENDTGEDFLVLQKNGGRTYVNGQLLLSNDANHNIRVMSTTQLTSNPTINPSGYQSTMNYYDIIVDNLTFTFDLNNMIPGMSFTFCNRVGSTMKFTTTLGQNIAIIDRDNGVFSSAQTMSLYNTRRINFVYMNNRVIETFRYP